MKILAVIPARAGSKGIPNKNIRLLGGHPLVYYAISNALKSKFITDVIVTTDSAEIIEIAKSMGVKYKLRDSSLCGDDVTLDSVIFDAVGDTNELDYIVTLQPTSPTLTVETLDNAIAKIIKEKYDTLISVSNKPHLSWTVKGNEIVKNYVDRLNRQYLPAHYIETGAFLIAKANYVTHNSRIGKKVGVYEVQESESVDIDDFNDLIVAASILNSKKIAIYVNGNKNRGLGHVYRALELADEFFVKPDIYFDVNQTDISVFGDTKHNLIPVNGIFDFFEKCKINNYSLIVNDILSTTIDYMIGLRSVAPNAKIVNFEDNGEGVVAADLVINALLDNSKYKNVKCGYQYYIAPKKFLYHNPIKISDHVKNVIVTFGGADPNNYTDRVIKIISSDEYKNFNFTVVLGREKDNVEELMKYNKFKNIKVYHDVKNMPALMCSCDIAITSRGRTGYELAILGIPTISIAQNTREEEHTFMCNENGFSYIGMNPPDEIIKANIDLYLNLSKESRTRFHEMLLSHDLKNGRGRVMRLINDL